MFSYRPRRIPLRCLAPTPAGRCEGLIDVDATFCDTCGTPRVRPSFDDIFAGTPRSLSRIDRDRGTPCAPEPSAATTGSAAAEQGERNQPHGLVLNNCQITNIYYYAGNGHASLPPAVQAQVNGAAAQGQGDVQSPSLSPKTAPLPTPAPPPSPQERRDGPLFGSRMPPLFRLPTWPAESPATPTPGPSRQRPLPDPVRRGEPQQLRLATGPNLSDQRPTVSDPVMLQQQHHHHHHRRSVFPTSSPHSLSSLESADLDAIRPRGGGSGLLDDSSDSDADFFPSARSRDLLQERHRVPLRREQHSSLRRPGSGRGRDDEARPPATTTTTTTWRWGSSLLDGQAGSHAANAAAPGRAAAASQAPMRWWSSWTGPGADADAGAAVPAGRARGLRAGEEAVLPDGAGAGLARNWSVPRAYGAGVHRHDGRDASLVEDNEASERRLGRARLQQESAADGDGDESSARRETQEGTEAEWSLPDVPAEP